MCISCVRRMGSISRGRGRIGIVIGIVGWNGGVGGVWKERACGMGCVIGV